MLSIKCGFVVVVLSIMASEGRVYNGFGKYRNGSDLSKYSSSYRHYNHYNLYRHYLHHLNRKHKYSTHLYDGWLYKQNYHYKRPSRYPNLDKIDDRLNFLAGSKHKPTTSNPFDELDEFKNSKLFSGGYVNSYRSYKSDGDTTTTNQIDHKHKHKGKHHEKVSDQDPNADSKGYMQDYTTSKPWENVRQDTVQYDEEKNITLKTTTTTTTTTESDLDKANSFQSFTWTELRPVNDTIWEKKKVTTPKPQGPRDAAFEHLEHVHKEGGCRKPKPRVVRVQDVHADPSKTYSPPCTILHYCGPDTGCCQNLKDVCKPKNTTKVELYFFVTEIGQPHRVDKLHFENHTECECRPKMEDFMPRDSPDVGNSLSNKIITASAIEKNSNCTCPTHYSPRHFLNGSCNCDCFDKQNDCLILKKGKANFSYSDRLCIQQSICRTPSCEFGSYIFNYGRCPKRNEKNHYNHLRSYFSRDRIT